MSAPSGLRLAPVLCLLACTGATDSDTGTDTTWEDPPTTTAALQGTDAVFLNPERGWYRYVTLADTTDLSWVRHEGSTLVYSYIRLDDHRASDIPEALLADVAAGMQAAREAGVKVIPRFAYNVGPYPDAEPDASLAWVLAHIEQVTALLDAVPAERAVQLRYPPHKEARYGGPLDASTAHDGSYASRIGHHNDCFLASDSDFGTYPSGERETWLTWLGQDNLHVPMGGETCNVYPTLTDCTPAVDELQRLRFTYVNRDYHPDVVAGWEAGGCDEEIERHLGYRLVATEITWPEQVRPGGVIPLSVSVANEGWAAPINPRPVRLVLTGDTTMVVDLQADVRTWLPGEEVTLSARLQLPGDLPEGTYELGLWLPDAAADLQDDPRFAIRLANDGAWREGWNALAAVQVDGDAPGSADLP